MARANVSLQQDGARWLLRDGTAGAAVPLRTRPPVPEDVAVWELEAASDEDAAALAAGVDSQGNLVPYFRPSDGRAPATSSRGGAGDVSADSGKGDEAASVHASGSSGGSASEAGSGSEPEGGGVSSSGAFGEEDSGGEEEGEEAGQQDKFDTQ